MVLLQLTFDVYRRRLSNVTDLGVDREITDFNLFFFYLSDHRNDI